MAFAFSFVLGQNMGQSDSMLSDRFESEKSEHEEDGKIGVVCSFCVNDFRGREEMTATCATLSVPREYDNSSAVEGDAIGICRKHRMKA